MSSQWYAIIDGAQDPRLVPLVQTCASHVCLYKGRDLAPELLGVAPWLVRIDPAEALLSAWQQHGQGGSWGIMLQSRLGLSDLRSQMRRFLQAKLPDGAIVEFRFYDPVVFNTYIRAATPEERAPWFESVAQYSIEDRDGAAMHHYRLIDGHLYDSGQPVAELAFQ